MYDVGEDCLTASGGRYIFLYTIARSRFMLVEITDQKSHALDCFKSVCLVLVIIRKFFVATMQVNSHLLNLMSFSLNIRSNSIFMPI
jgi:presenilin-like A22 family membrane protease